MKSKSLLFTLLALALFACNEKEKSAPEVKANPAPVKAEEITSKPSAHNHDHDHAHDQAPEESSYYEMEGMGYKYFNYGIPLAEIKNAPQGLTPLAGKGAIVFLFSSTCPHCKKAYPHLDEVTKVYRAKGLPVYAVASSSNTPQTIASFIEETKLSVPLLQDSEREFSKLYGVGTVPLTLWIESDGRYMKFPSFERDLPVLLKQVQKAYP